MITFNEHQKNLILQAASFPYLNEELPVNFSSVTAEKQDAILTENASDRFQLSSPSNIYEYIDGNASRLEYLLSELVGGLEEPVNNRYYLVEIKKLIDGQEVLSKAVINADCKGDAIEQAFHNENYGEDLSGFEWVVKQYSATSLHGEINLYLESIDEVSPFEAMVLKKYI